jgi:hypothetical protein
VKSRERPARSISTPTRPPLVARSQPPPSTDQAPPVKIPRSGEAEFEVNRR